MSVPWPPVATLPLKEKGWSVPVECTRIPLPLRHTPMVTTGPRQVGAKAAFAQAPISPARRARVPCAWDIMLDFDISRTDMSMIYMSPDPYFDAFEEILQLKHANLQKNATAGLTLYESNGHVHLAGRAPGTLAAKIPDWGTRVKGAWLIKIGDKTIATIDDVTRLLRELVDSGDTTVVLLFSHPELRPNLSHNGLPIVSSAPFTQQVHDQLNNHWEFTTVVEHLKSTRPTYHIADSGGSSML
jgi:hypothetical protein